jgi:hypothetical protein
MIKRILILAANPRGTTRLRLDQQLREVDAGLQRARHRNQFVLQQRWAVRPRDIQRAMLDFEPQIVHFSGHGAEDEGLVFEDDTGREKLVDGEALAGLFELFAEQVECVVLNACYSAVQADAITRHINYVIGMNQAIGDEAAIEFTVGFYDALGAGRSVEFAYRLGCAAVRLDLAGTSEYLTPILKTKSHIIEPVAQPTLNQNQSTAMRIQQQIQEVEQILSDAQFAPNFGNVRERMLSWRRSAIDFITVSIGSQEATHLANICAPDSLRSSKSRLLYETNQCRNYLTRLLDDLR